MIGWLLCLHRTLFEHSDRPGQVTLVGMRTREHDPTFRHHVGVGVIVSKLFPEIANLSVSSERTGDVGPDGVLFGGTGHHGEGFEFALCRSPPSKAIQREAM